MRSGMQHLFSQVPRAEIPRSSFDRSHNFKATMNAGDLVPFYVDEVIPGDTFHLKTSLFMRLATPLHPFMDNMVVDMFFFACPLRLIWNNFQKFMGEQDNPGDSTSFLVPSMTSPAGGYNNGNIYDYMGIPTKVPGLVHSALWLRAYNLAWNQWFRDQNMQNSVVVNKGDGPDNPNDYAILRRGKRHDYFTSALPWPQKGPAVSLPLGSQAVVKSGTTEGFTGVQTGAIMRLSGTGSLPGASTVLGTSTDGKLKAMSTAGTVSAGDYYFTNLYADLSSATAATINQLRQAFAIQKIYERDARGGTRYTELVQAHFNVTSPDARLQRVEYLGGGSVPLNVNPIAQTSNTAGAPSPQGNLAGMGTVSGHGSGFTKSFTEHCVLIGLVSARADLNYQQGLNRMWSRSTRWDFYWPALSAIGEQSILNKEIYAVGSANPTQDAAVFGYQERYAEYRYKPSIVTGQFRSNDATTLDTWHLAQNFGSLPGLNSAFIVENPPVARVIAVPSEPHFLLDAHFTLKCARPMPVFGVPGNIDRF